MQLSRYLSLHDELQSIRQAELATLADCAKTAQLVSYVAELRASDRTASGKKVNCHPARVWIHGYYIDGNMVYERDFGPATSAMSARGRAAVACLPKREGKPQCSTRWRAELRAGGINRK